MPQSLENWLIDNPPVGGVSSRTPSLRERQTQFLSNMLFSDDREGQRKAERLVSVADMTPLGLPAMAYDLGQGVSRGDPLSLGAGAAAAALHLPALRAASGQRRGLKEFFSDTRGTFGGEKALKADKGLLKAAQEMEASGSSRDEIIRVTGWFRQKDGKWRFEIDDSKAQMTGKASGELGTVMKHPELYENYPKLARVRVESRELPAGIQGMHDAANNRVSLSYKTGSPEKRDILLHEVTHPIQDIEGFSPGANPSPAQALIKGTYANQVLNEMVRPGMASSPSLTREAAQEGYLRGLGEVEARNVQRRKDMNAIERREIPPWVTQSQIEPEEKVLVEERGTGLRKLFGKLGLGY